VSAVSDMPVGCLAHRARHSGWRRADSRDRDTRDSRTRRQAGEQITLMQHTLLLQIFRTEASPALSCPTCISFSPSCCQTESGWSILAKVVEANCQCVWNMPLVKAISCLQFQGYVCPGMLILLTNEAGVQILQESWFKRTLVSPEGFKIYRLGLSGGCSVTPFPQGPGLSLPDAICWILLHFKQTGKAANMHNIIQKVISDFPGMTVTKHMTATVHQALGTLIKSRKVYYTGKGYFLVTPEQSSVQRMKLPDTCQSSNNWSIRMRQDKSSQTEQELSETPASASCWPVDRVSDNSEPATRKLWSAPKLNSFEDKSNLTKSNNILSPTGWKSRCSPISPDCQLSTRSSPGLDKQTSQKAEEFMETNLLPDSRKSKNYFTQRTLQRSQSLRLSKDSKRKIYKGGSLRLAKEEAKTLLEFKNESICEKDVKVSSPPTHKPLERKDSILGRLFSRKKPPKEIRVFSGQFPPPETDIPHVAPQGCQKQKNWRPPLPMPWEDDSSNDKCKTENTPEKSRNLQNLSPKPNRLLKKDSFSSVKIPPGPVIPESIPNEHIYSVPNTSSKPLPPYSSAPPYRQKPTISQLYLSKSLSPPKQVKFSSSPPHSRRAFPQRIKSPPARRSLKYQSLSSASTSSSPSSLSGPSSIESVLDSNATSDTSHNILKETDAQTLNTLNQTKVYFSSYRNLLNNNKSVVHQDSLSDLSPSSSVSTLKPDSAPDHPTLSDLGSITDLSTKFQSLTARKMMAGLSTGSIDTLVEINAAHDKHKHPMIDSHNESTETIDFGII